METSLPRGHFWPRGRLGGGRPAAIHFLFALTLLFIGCEPVPRSTAAPAQPPRIVFASLVHDFGEIEQGTKIAYAFPFTNRGGVDLTIDRMRGGCGCDASVDVERVVPPNGGARLRVQCDTTTAFGKQRRTVSIYSNDPVAPVSVVRLVGTVRAEATLTPSPFYVGRVHRGERVRRDGFARWSSSRGPFDVVADGDAGFRVELSPPAAGSDRAAFTLVMKEDAALGPITGRLHLQNAAARSLRTVPVVGEIVPDVSVSPLAAELLAEKGTDARSASVIVHNAGARSVRLTAAEWPLGTATVDTLDPGKRYRIVLTPGKPVSTNESELVVRTDHPEQPELRVTILHYRDKRENSRVAPPLPAGPCGRGVR